ncbi:MAG: enoyl-CoA hydratase-related protein [Bacteroidota bacterium]
MENNEYVRYEVENRVAYITLDRPEKRNAFNAGLVTEMRQAFITAEAADDVKVIVLRANGKAFCAGADLAYLKKLQKFDLEQNLQDSMHLKDLFEMIYRLTKPVIAQVEGHAIAGGAGLVTVCDFAFSVPTAKFGYTEVRIGFIPAIVMTFLLRKCGELRAKELLLTGDIIDAEKAVRYNMINDVVPAEEIADKVKAFAENLCKQNSAQSMMITKKMIADIQTFPVREALTFAAKWNAKARATEDCRKGIAAFLNKEPLEW